MAVPDVRIFSIVLALAGARLLWRDIARALNSTDRSHRARTIRFHLKRKLLGFLGSVLSATVILFAWAFRWPPAVVWLFAVSGILSTVLWIREVFRVHALDSADTNQKKARRQK